MESLNTLAKRETPDNMLLMVCMPAVDKSLALKPYRFPEMELNVLIRGYNLLYTIS